MRKASSATVLAIALTALGGSPALAYLEATSNRGGARATTSASGGTVYAFDEACDNHGVKANFKGAGYSGSLPNANGCNGPYTKTSPGFTTTSLQACVVYNNFPDACGNWVSN